MVTQLKHQVPLTQNRMTWYTSLSTDDLVARLQKANWAYRNTDKPLMSDYDYDLGFEELRRRSPQHPFLKVVGAPTEGTVVLPYVMGSLNKIRAGEGTLERFVKRCASAEAITASDKLDGLSAVLVLQNGKPPKMYLQGDGVRGVDVSRAARLIQGCHKPGLNAIIRGELILPLADTPEGSIGRSLVNGWMHKSLDSSRSVPEDLRKVHFVAYSIYEPSGIRRDEQFEWLYHEGFEIPWYQHWPIAEATEKRALAVLLDRRQSSSYPLDGIVLGSASVPEVLGGGEDKNPIDACAFKASLEDQKATTKVLGIEWNESRQGFLIPRVQIEPVQIGGATIQWLSGHNAKLIYDGGIGPGAKIVVRRSGDVIPTLDEVLEPVTKAALPPGEGQRWEWDATKVHAKLKEQEDPAPGLLHALQTFKVAGIGPGLVRKLVDGGLKSVADLRKASDDELSTILGPGRGPTFRGALQEAVQKAEPMDLLIASNKMPRGCGERKLRSLFEIEANYTKWTPMRFGCDAPSGWTASSLSQFWMPFAEAKIWIENTFADKNLKSQPPAMSCNGVNRPSVPVPKGTKGGVCFSNCRDKDLEARLVASGYEIHESVSKKTSVLVVPDGNDRETTKVKKARDLGLRIVQLSDFTKEV